MLRQFNARVKTFLAHFARKRSITWLCMTHKYVVSQVGSGLEPLSALRTEEVLKRCVVFEPVTFHRVVTEQNHAANFTSHLVVMAVVVRI